MSITTKTTKAEMLKIIQDLRDEATGWHQHAKQLEDRLTSVIAENIECASLQVNQAHTQLPWLFPALALVVGIVIGSML